MSDFLKEALMIVKAQAGVRIMNEEQILSMIKKVAEGIKNASDGLESGIVEERPEKALNPLKAIREQSIVCLECGKQFKVLTKRHLARHNLTPEQYKLKHGYKKTMPLVAKSLARDRRKKMQDMRLWEKRKTATPKAE